MKPIDPNAPRPALPAGHGTKLGRKKEEAVAALVTHFSVESAARSLNVSPQTLYRWLKIPAFEAACNAAREAQCRQALGRLQQASGRSVTSLLKTMYDPQAPRTVQLRAADRALSHQKEIRKIGDIAGRLRAVKRTRQETQAEAQEQVQQEGRTEPGGKAAGKLHGGLGAARLSPKRQKAIEGLLTRRNNEEAARYAGVAPSTLYRWRKDPEFAAAYRQARLVAFGKADALLQQAAGSAASVILKIQDDADASHEERVRAADLALKHGTAASASDIEEWLTELEAAGKAVPAAWQDDSENPGESHGVGAVRRRVAELERAEAAAVRERRSRNQPMLLKILMGHCEAESQNGESNMETLARKMEITPRELKELLQRPREAYASERVA